MGPNNSNPSSSCPIEQDQRSGFNQTRPLPIQKYTHKQIKQNTSSPTPTSISHFSFPIFPSLQWWRTAILGSTSFRFVSLKIISFFLQNLCLKASNSTPLSCVVSRVSSGFWRSHGRMQLCWTRIGLFTGLDFLIFARQFQSKAVKWYFCQEIPSQKWTLFPFLGSFCSWVFSLFDC